MKTKIKNENEQQTMTTKNIHPSQLITTFPKKTIIDNEK